MLQGKYVPPPLFERLFKTAVTLAALTPWTIFGGVLCLLGIQALGQHNDRAELWICLPPGLLILILVGALLYRIFWLNPRRTVIEFIYEGEQLAVDTRKHGQLVLLLSDLLSIQEDRSVRGSVLMGYWLKWNTIGWLYLDRDTTSADDLMRQIGHRVEYQAPSYI